MALRHACSTSYSCVRSSVRRTIMPCDDMICCLPFLYRDLAERMHERRLVGPRAVCRACRPHAVHFRNLRLYETSQPFSSYPAVPTSPGAWAWQRQTILWGRATPTPLAAASRFPQSPPGPRGRGQEEKQPRRAPAGASPTPVAVARPEKTRARVPRQAVQGSSPTGVRSPPLGSDRHPPRWHPEGIHTVPIPILRARPRPPARAG